MILCLDVGNSQIYGGVFKNDQILLRFRYDSKQAVTSDQLGVFLKSVLRENELDAKYITQIAICSVVPPLDYSLRSACRKYFNVDPFFLQPGVKTGLKIKYRNPLEVGADRIANAVAAVVRYPNQHLIIVDFGTATTFCAITKNKEYLGGMIMPGMRLSMEALQLNTAKLSSVKIVRPECIIGRSTSESIQSGLYYGQLAAMQETTRSINREYFHNENVIILGTGGFAHLFEPENIFTLIVPDLVLEGLLHTLYLNCH